MAQGDLLRESQTQSKQALHEMIKVLKHEDAIRKKLLKDKVAEDVMDYLRAVFQFQVDNVKNQRDHILHLLTNTQLMLMEVFPSWSPHEILAEAIRHVSDKILENYDLWYEHTKSWANSGRHFERERLLMACLYLLIWGEAANLRFLPECLCYVFHNMLGDLFVAPTTETSSFLNGVVRPVYFLLESEKKRLKISHTRWSNYDDFNELFWSPECLDLFEWENKRFKISATMEEPKTNKPKYLPLKLFRSQTTRRRDATAARMSDVKQSWDEFVLSHGRKVNFLERRTFLHIYHSFHRFWILLVLMLQGMIVSAFSHFSIKYLLSLAPSHALMMFIQSVLDLVFCYDPLRLRGLCCGVRRAHAGGAHKFRILFELLFYALATSLFTFLYIKALLCHSPEQLDCDGEAYFRTYKLIVVAYFGVHLAHAVLYTVLSSCPTESRIVARLKWLFKEQYFVGHNMRVKALDILKYGTFWTLLLAAKFFVSYKLQIEPLADPTKIILRKKSVNYAWHDIISKRHYNALAVASIWTPLVLIYFLDVQIWYTVFSALYGCIRGGLSHLGEIRTMVMFVDSFYKLPGRFASQLVNPPLEKFTDRIHQAQTFVPYWNELVKNLREEDYISNREHSLLLMGEQNMEVIQWPLFILISKVQLALSLAEKEKLLLRKLQTDRYMRDAVKDVYCNVEVILEKLVGIKPNDERRKWFINLTKFGKDFLKYLRKSFIKEDVTIKLLTDRLVELIEALHKTTDKVEDSLKAFLILFLGYADEKSLPELQKDKVKDEELKRVVGRLFELLSQKDPALNVPRNGEAQRRLIFFGNSLGMRMPKAPSLEHMLSFSVLTPHFGEVVLYSLKYLAEENKDGITNLYYLQLVYSDEWKFFLQRTGLDAEEVKIFTQIGEKHEIDQYPLRHVRREELRKRWKQKGKGDVTDDAIDNKVDSALKSLRLWASYRGQTLARTVRGMMLYKKALQFQHTTEQKLKADNPQTVELASVKFTFVITCQEYDSMQKSPQKSLKKSMADDIDFLMKMYPDLRMAYIAKENDKYQSKLRKWENGKLEDIYSIDLPGSILIGEGKPENQNHAIVFTRGDALQAIDMNQDNYFEETLKMRNLLEEFRFKKHFKSVKHKAGRVRRTILGVREHVFTGSVSSLAWFMSNQESSFVTIGQRVMANPLKVRMHYGHPDVFDRVFHITRGGISKASKTINLSEDIFAGFNSTLRGGRITHHEYIQVGKGRDLGLNQISAFEAKVASGNGEQMLSRDVYRLGRYFDFGRMLSFYHTSVGYYVSTMLVVWALYAYMYGKVYLALSGVESDMLENTKKNKALKGALAIQFIFQTGIFNCIPMVMGFILEQGFLKAIQCFVFMLVLGSPIFFAFSLATRCHYFGRTLLHGGATYRKTGRGFVIEHIEFAENFRFYCRSHFIKGLELVMLLAVYAAYGKESNTGSVFFLVCNFLLAICWLYGPFIFNPLGFEWQKSVEDISNWNKWLTNKNVGAQDQDSWTTWWEKQTEFSGFRPRFFEIILSIRFFVIQYGIVYHLTENRGNKRLLVYGISMLLFLSVAAMLAFMSITTTSRNKMRFAHALALALLFGLFITGGFLVVRLNVLDVLASMVALIPTGWGLLCIAVACKPILTKVWWMVSTWAWCYDAAMGYFIFGPVIFLSWFPFISPIHTRILYNQAFSRGLEISVLLSGQDLKISKT